MKFTLIRARKPKMLTKHFEIGADGTQKKTVHGQLWQGAATVTQKDNRQSSPTC